MMETGNRPCGGRCAARGCDIARKHFALRAVGAQPVAPAWNPAASAWASDSK